MFDHYTLVLLLKEKSLEVFSKEKELFEKIPLSEEVVKNFAVVDKSKLETLLNDFFSTLGLQKQKALLILSKEVLFERTLLLDTPEEEKVQTEKFIAEIPFEENKLVKKEIRRDKALYILATPRDLFEDLVDVLEKSGVSVSAVVPLGLLEGFSGKDSLTPSEVVYILSQADSIKEGDLLSSVTKEEKSLSTPPAVSSVETSSPTPQQSVQEEKPEILPVADPVSKATEVISVSSVTSKEEKKSSKWPLMLLMGVLLVGLGFLGSSVYFGVIKNPLFSSEADVSGVNSVKDVEKSENPVVVIEEDSSSSAELEKERANYKDKEVLAVKVLNGSGKVGEAGKVKEQLLKLGFKEIETGNSSKFGSTETKVSFSKNVSPEVKLELINDLSNVFKTVTEGDGIDSPDILVTTGE